VFFTGGALSFLNFGGSPNVVNGTFNLGGPSLTLNADLAINGAVNLHSPTSIGLGTNSLVFQSTINGANDLTITGSGAGTITFNGAIGGTTALADLSITTAQPLALPQTRATGDLDVTASEISQFGRLIVGGAASFDASSGAVPVELMQAANDFQGVVNLTSPAGGTHRITDANDLQLGTISLPGATLEVQTGASGTATGHLTQTQPLGTLASPMSQLRVQTLSDDTSNITLNLANFMSNTTEPFRLQKIGDGDWGNVSLRNDFGAGSFALNNGGTWATITGNLNVQTLTGINQVSPITVVGTTTLNPGGGTINLPHGGNNFVGPVNVTGAAATDHRVTDANDLQLGAVSIHTNANLILQTGASGTATGHLTQTVPLSMSQLRVETLSDDTSDITLNLANMMTNTTEPFRLDNVGSGTWGDVRLRNDFVNGDLQLNSTGNWAEITGVLHVQTGAGISQSGRVVVGGAATLEAGGSVINLQNPANDFQGTINLASTAGGVNRVTDANNLQLGTIDLGLFGDLRVQTGASGTDTGHLTQTVPFGTLMNPFMGQVQVQTLSNDTSDITLNLANFFSNTTEPFVLDNSLGTGSWGNVSLRNEYGAGAFSVNNNGHWANITGDLSIFALTGFSQANPIVVVGTSRFETSNSQIQLTHNSNDFQGVVTPVGGTNVALFQGILHDLKVAPVTAQQLTLSSGAGIDLSAGTYGASVGPLSLTATGTIDLTTGPVTFSGANGISILGHVAGPGALVINHTGTLSSIDVNGSLGTIGAPLGGLTINETHVNGFFSNASAFVAGDVDLTSAHRIIFGGPLSVSGTSRFEANNNIVELTGANNFVGVVTVVGGAVTDINQNSVNPLRVAPLTTERLRIQSQQSDVALTAGTYEATFDTVDIAALGGNSITLGAGTVTLDAANGLVLVGDVEGPGALVLNQRGLGGGFSVSGTLGTSGARIAGLTIDNAGFTGIQLSGSGAFVTGDLDITSAADIRLGTSAVSGTSRFEAGNHAVVINGSNDFVGVVTLIGANDVHLAQNSPNPLRVAPLSADSMWLASQQSNVQLTAGTYESRVGNIRIDASGGNSIALGAGTVTLDAQNGLQLNGNVAGPGALSIEQRNAGALISVAGSLGTSAARLGGLTIDDQSTIGMSLGTTDAFVAGNVDVTAAGPIQLRAMAVSGSSQFRFQPGVQAGVSIFDPNNDFEGLVTVLDGTFVHIAQGSTNPLRVAPLIAENMTILSWQSDIQLAAGTYQSTVGSLDIGTLGGDAVVLGAGTVTLDGANGVSVGGGDVHGPGGLIVHQRNASGYVLSESLGTPGSRLASLEIHNASTNNLSLGNVDATGAVSVETAGDLTLPSGTVVSSFSSDVVLAGVDFVNNAGSGALSAGGRWLVYSTSPSGSTEGGLASATNTRLYNRTFAANPPASIAGTGNHLVYSFQPTLIVEANDVSRSYGAANPALSFSHSGLVSQGYADSLTDAGLTGAPATAATSTSAVAGSPYAITQGTLALTGSSGYSLSFTGGQLTILPVPLTVTADNASRAYGQSNPPFSASYAGFLLGDTPASLGGALGYSTPATFGSGTGTYPITPFGLTSSNYAISFVDGALTVTPPPAVVAPAATITATVAEPLRAYVDTLAGIQGNRVAAPLPVEYDRMVTIENGGIRLPPGLQP
jgi:hypothetical protein